jgi:2-oxoglutarate dehydrogenase E1 component
MSDGRFEPVLADTTVDPSEVRRLILCSGKIYYELDGHALRAEASQVAVARVELLYPFPQKEILSVVERYPNLREVVWVQEEPRNMGARAHMSARLRQILPEQLEFGYIGRPERASPGEGYPVAHALEQDRIVQTALNFQQPVSQFPGKPPGER